MIRKRYSKFLTILTIASLTVSSSLPAFASEAPVTSETVLVSESDTSAESNQPDTDSAETQPTDMPETETSNEPESQVPETETQESNSPETKVPETDVPETETSETETQIPETIPPETVTPPEEETPSTGEQPSVPETDAPEQNLPEKSQALPPAAPGSIFQFASGSFFELSNPGTGQGVLAFLHTTSARFSSGFGWRNLGGNEFHTGVDIAVPAETPILCAGPGKVVINDYNSARGWQIVIDHGIIGGSHIYTRYQHMIDQSPYPVGTEVAAGQVLGGVGNTGRSFGNHLHFEILKNGLNYMFNEIDPRGEEAELYYSILRKMGEKTEAKKSTRVKFDRELLKSLV